MRESGLPPNQGLQRTALRADKIVAILKSDFGWTAFSIYGCAAAEAQAVGRHSVNACLLMIYSPYDHNLP